MRKRRLPPMPDPPEGLMWLNGHLVPIVVVEEDSEFEMARFDNRVALAKNPNNGYTMDYLTEGEHFSVDPTYDLRASKPRRRT